MPFMFESLDVYKKAISFTVVIFNSCVGISDRLFKDQLKRAALSIPLNIAEGNGRIHIKEKKQYFYTARGSLLECVPILQLLKAADLIEERRYSELYALADEIGKMLNGLIRSVDKQN